MNLKEKLLDWYQPLTFFEMVPPAADKPGAADAVVGGAESVRRLVDAVNLPEIHDENRAGSRAVKFVPRLEPRVLGGRIQRELGLEAVINRCVVYEPDPVPWFRQTESEYGIHHVVLVGGESSRIQYPGPGVLEAAGQLAAANVTTLGGITIPSRVQEAGQLAAANVTTLGGITIPSRVQEAERVRRKAAAGLSFFTTQVLFDANDIVWLIQRLNGLEARVFLSFAPVSHVRDLEFLRWLGADIPADLDRFLLSGSSPQSARAEDGRPAATCLERSLDLAQRILLDVFDNLPPDPPCLGLNIEHVNQRNFVPAVRMLEKLGELYGHLVSARASLA